MRCPHRAEGVTSLTQREEHSSAPVRSIALQGERVATLLAQTTPPRSSCYKRGLQFDTGVDGRDSKSEVLVRLSSGEGEAGVVDHLGEAILGREPLDRLDEVLVRVSVGGEELANVWNHLERVLSVDPGEVEQV